MSMACAGSAISLRVILDDFVGVQQATGTTGNPGLDLAKPISELP